MLFVMIIQGHVSRLLLYKNTLGGSIKLNYVDTKDVLLTNT